ALGCYYGLEVMARVALVGMLFIFLLNGLITIGSLGEFDIRNLLPVLERGFPQAVKASAYFDGDWALATMMAALVMPMVKDVKLRGHLGMVGMLASGLIIAIWSLLEGAVLSSEVTSQYTISCMKLARNAHIGNFLQRYEMIMIAFYSVSALFEIMFCVYGAAICASKLFGLRSHKPMIVPACILLGCFGYWVIKDHFHALHYLEHQWPYIALPIAFGLPLLLLALRMALGWRLDSAAK
ncbi:MAG: spore germination protein, partial [Paenibacillus sp.]|nr:spore germination protein [Paenibacillus sp.]